jgi:hypothetical protein
VYAGFWWDNVGKNHLEDLDVDGQTLLKLIFMKEWVDMDWIDVGQAEDKLRAFVNAALKLRIP